MPAPDLEEKMSQLSDTELIKIFISIEENDESELNEAAKKEFLKRKLTAEQFSEALKEMAPRIFSTDEKAVKPLSGGMKIIPFIIPFFMLIARGSYRRRGYHRKATELTTWTLYGIGFYVCMSVLLELLMLTA